MAAVWDTTLAAQLRPDSPAHEYCLDQIARGKPVFLAAGALLETAAGYQSALARRPAFGTLLRWLEVEVVSEQLCSIVAMGGFAAFVAGRLRAVTAPPPAARRDRRSKAARRAAWQLDIQIAATCWAAGHDVATDNVTDFECLAEALAALYPNAPRLQVAGPPF